MSATLELKRELKTSLNFSTSSSTTPVTAA